MIRTVHRRALRGFLAASLALVLGAGGASALPAAGAPLRATPRVTRGIATFGAVPAAWRVRALRELGLTVQPMKHLPLALVRGTFPAQLAAVERGLVQDVYPDEAVELHDRTSSDAIGAAWLRARGLTGRGVTVATVDSGCDASHPDLADHVVHNVKLYSAEYANISPDGSNTIAVPVEIGPYQNSDVGGGHGTHVTGIIGADGTTDPAHLGVAPDAELVCFSIGEVLFTTAVITAYDYLLDQPDLWGVDVINNSWGNTFRQYDPRHPMSITQRTMNDLGVVVVFSAGNMGWSDAEMSHNAFSQAPWVTAVANGDVTRHRADSSSAGLRYDNSIPGPIGRGGHTVYLGNRVGNYHPDVTAPGTDISSSCDTLGAAVGPCPPGENTEASGTSMAAPHVSGAAAVLLQANPRLSPEQVRMALQATAGKVMGFETTERAPFWQSGYGWVDLRKAVALVRRPDYAKALTAAQRAADRRVLASFGHIVTRSDWWTFDAPRVAVEAQGGGLVFAGNATQSMTVRVPRGITHLKITLSHPSLAFQGENQMEWEVEVFDAANASLGTTTEAPTGAGTASLLLDLREADATYGEFTVVTRGNLAVSDPDTFDSESLMGRLIALQVAQVVER
jgi:serine protease AprX